MGNEQLWLGFGLLGLFLAYRYVWIPTCSEVFRERVFDLRHELFMLMRREKFAPTTPSYVHLRHLMNGWLRFADRVSLARVLYSALFGLRRRFRMVPYEDALDDSDLPPEVVEKLRELHMRLVMQVVYYVIWRSPVLWIALGLMLVVAAAFGGFQKAAMAIWSNLFPSINDEVLEDAYGGASDPTASGAHRIAW